MGCEDEEFYDPDGEKNDEGDRGEGSVPKSIQEQTLDALKNIESVLESIEYLLRQFGGYGLTTRPRVSH